MRIVEGSYDGRGLRVAVVVSRFNSTITDRLLEGAIDCLVRHGVSESDIEIYRVPGGLEVIYTVGRLLSAADYDAIVVLAAIVRGETYHFNVVANEIGKAIANYNMRATIPVTFGVITADTLEQAINRAGAKSGNKGFEAAMAALEMVNLRKSVEKSYNRS